MKWFVPPKDAVSVGEMDGEVISLTPKDEFHLAESFVRRGGSIFLPARVLPASNTSQQPPPPQVLHPRGSSTAAATGAVGAAAGWSQGRSASAFNAAFGVSRKTPQRNFLQTNQHQTLANATSKGSLVQQILEGIRVFCSAEEMELWRLISDKVQCLAHNSMRLVKTWNPLLGFHAKRSQRVRLEQTLGQEQQSNGFYDDQYDDEEQEAYRELSLRRKGPIVAMHWHPFLNMMAVARDDGNVAFYELKTCSWEQRVLHHPAQQEISCVRWANHSSGTLAVASRGGIFVWEFKPNNKKQVPRLLHVFENEPGSRGFCDLSWNADGSQFAACAHGSRSVFIMDVISLERTELACESSIVSSLHWSPTGEYLFVSLRNRTCIVWETCTWSKDIWEINCETCAWSPNGQCLLVSLRDRAQVHPYKFHHALPSIDASIASCAIEFDAKRHVAIDRSIAEMVGGIVTAMAWDPSGTRVAVTFRSPSTSRRQGASHKEEEGGNLVAILKVDWKPFLIFTRSGLLRGPPNAGVPVAVEFSSQFEQGALLSVAWSSGLLTFVPFYFDHKL